MKILSKPVGKPSFQPFTIEITIESQQEYNDMFALFSYYGTIPDEVTSNADTHNRMHVILREIYDRIEEANQ